MKGLMKFTEVTRIHVLTINNAFGGRLFKGYCTEPVYTAAKERKIHPYRKIHPWKSLDDFSKHLMNNIIYNKDGIVALTKPYGISGRTPYISKDRDISQFVLSNVPNSVSYTMSDSLAYIAKELNYSELYGVIHPEKYMSGVTILASNKSVADRIQKSFRRGQGFMVPTKTYWLVTTRVSNHLSGKVHAAIKLKSMPNVAGKKPIITTVWRENERKNGEIKIINIEFKVLSNSTQNLSSLVELKTSTRKWHTIRLFAATMLYAPVLGDNLYGSRIQKVGDSWLQVDPFLPSTQLPPILDKNLLDILHLTPAKQELIPVHIHLRSVYLPSLFKRGEDITIEAPLVPHFSWTCQKLQFKNITTDLETTEIQQGLQESLLAG